MDEDAGLGGAGGGVSGPPGDPDLDAGLGPENKPDTSVPGGRSERKFCGLEGQQFTTRLFPSGERLQALDLEHLRSFGRVVGTDTARGELFVESCVKEPDAFDILARYDACSLDRFSAGALGFAPPLHKIRLSPGESVASVAVDAATDNLIALVTELDDLGVVTSTRVLTLARNAADLTAPVRQLDPAVGGAYPLGFDAERGEIYAVTGDDVSVFAREASGSAAPLRSVTFADPGGSSFLISPLHGAYYRAVGSTLETYALPVTQGDLPLRTLTALPGSLISIDEAHEELWLLDGELLHVFDLTASGEAVSLRSIPRSFGLPVAGFSQGDEIALQAFNGGPVSFYARTDIDGAALRVLEGADRYLGGHELLAIDVPRQEVFFLGENGVVTVYALDATADAAPLRRLSTSLRPQSSMFDQENAELLDTDVDQLMAYPAGAEGEATADLRLALDVGGEGFYSFRLDAIDAVHEQLLGVVEPSGGGAVDDVSDDSHDPGYVALSDATGELAYPVTRISTWRGPRSHWVSNDLTQGRRVNVIDLAYDSRHDEVVVAVKDCFYEESGPGAAYVFEHSDCYHELRSYPRTADGNSGAFRLLELPEELRSLDYDAESDMLLVSTQSRVLFLARSEPSGDALTPNLNAGTDAGPIARAPAHEFPFAGTFQYCD